MHSEGPQLISVPNHHEVPCEFQPWSKVQQNKPFLHMPYFETFADFSATGNAWKPLLLWGMQVKFIVPQSIFKFDVFHFSKAFLAIGRYKDWVAERLLVGRTGNWYLTESLDITMCAPSTFLSFQAGLILNLLDFHCCSQTDGKITSHCLVQPNIVCSTRSISGSNVAWHCINFSVTGNAWEAL